MIIYLNYIKTKPKIKFQQENFSWIKVICFCFNKKKLEESSMSKELILKEIDKFFISLEIKLYINFISAQKDPKNDLLVEIDSTKNFNSSIMWLNTRYEQMNFSFLCKDSEEDVINDNKYKNTDWLLILNHYFVNINYKIRLLNCLNINVLELKQNLDKTNTLNDYNKLVNSSDSNFIAKRKNEKKKIKSLKKKYKKLVHDIEQIRKVNKNPAIAKT